MSNPLFRRKKVIRITKDLFIHGDNIDFTFSTNFDDNLEPNEASVTIYNLSDETINKIKVKQDLSIDAGYGDDHGYIFYGFIDEVSTKFDGVDKVTTITALDNKSYESTNMTEKSYSKNTKASTILKDMAKIIDLPIAVFKLKTDYVYKNGWTAGGAIIEEMNKVAVHCGASVYINKRKLYIRPLTEGDDDNFELSVETGLIGSPEYFEETKEVTLEDVKYNSETQSNENTSETQTQIIKGYKVKCLLQHKVTTASIIKLKSKRANGTFRVRSGTHRGDDNDFTTELELIFTS